MSTIKIETLTAVHIGSGETLQYGSDFVKGIDGEDNILGIIDPQKVMMLIGEQNIDKWVTAIEKKETTNTVVEIYAPKARINDYSSRIILNYCSNITNRDTLKEHIHDGNGTAYIPGSSIKGAIRTAVLSSIMSNEDKQKYESEIISSVGGVSANKVEGKLFGKTPNEDVFRFLHVGDAFFGRKYEIAFRMVNINERNKMGFWDISKPQLIEALSPDDEATFQIKLDLAKYNIAKGKVSILPESMKTISALFHTINEHTKSLIENEIEYWQQRVKNDESGCVDLYLKKMKEIKTEAEQCKGEKSCVLRIGHGSGWRFITGAWTEKFDNFYSAVVPKARPKHQQYKEFEFPKTRRVDEDCDLLGFVKLIEI